VARILIIDDDKDFGEITARRLGYGGHKATFYLGPFGSVNAIRKGEFDLVILDISMPALTGAQIVQLIRETKGLGHLKILLYSGMETESLHEEASKLDVNSYLSKSASKDELLAKVKQLLQALPR
jgi:CheY-like chemotaxis protein